jgi:metallo-beta-lactamase class B
VRPSHPHTHPDHAGGIAELQKGSGADVHALRPANEVLIMARLRPMIRRPRPGQWHTEGILACGPGRPADRHRSIRMCAIATPGHTPGGTTWTWDACEGSKCLKAVYADSLSPVSSGKYRFSDDPEVVQGFEKSYRRLEALPCELLLTPHPSQSQMFERLDKGATNTEAVKDADGCRKYVATAREALAQRLQTEKQGR